MAYIGKEPVRGQNRELDDISGSFNGGNTAFTMQVGGINTSAGSANQCFISVGGVLQNPGTDFTVASSTITFTTPPASGLDFWGIIQGDAVDINTPADASVTNAKIVDDTIKEVKLDIDNAPTNDHVLTADSTTGGGMKWAAASGTTINNNADNRVITGSGTANTLEGESNVNVDGGKLIVGATTSTTEAYQANIQSIGGEALTLGRAATAHQCAEFAMVKTRNASWGSNTIVADDDGLGLINFYGDDGTDYKTPAASILASVDGTPGANDMPGRLTFNTTADGASSTTERMRIGSDGKWYKNTKQILLPLQFYQVNVTGSTNFNTTTSWPDTKTLVTNFSPVKGGSRLWISWQVQTYWPSTSASAATDVYARIMATNTSAGAGYNEVWKNSRWAGNFSGTGNTRLQSYKLSLFTCVTASDGADMDFKLQAFMGSTLSDDFNICHTDEYNYFSIWEYDIT